MFRKTSLMLGSLALALSAAACSPTRYAYAPVTTTSAEIVGHPAADYAVPPDSPQGRVRLATFGIAQLQREGRWFFHVRMSARNESQETWSVDKNEQVLEIAIGDDRERTTRVRPAIDVDDTPTQVEVPSRETRSLDLFFPLPPGAEDATDVPEFKVVWTVRAGARDVTVSTPFQRFLASGPARNVPRAEPNYPLSNGVGPGGRLPGTPDNRWPQPEPSPEKNPVPVAPLP